MRFLRLLPGFLGMLVRMIASLALWTLWLALAILLAVQIRYATSTDLEVPDFVRQALLHRLAEPGLRVEYDRARFDPSGRILIENVRISVANQTEPIFLARSIYGELNPWPLLVGQVEWSVLRVNDAQLMIPAQASPTGKSEPIVDALNFVVRPALHDLLLPGLQARVGRFLVTVSGALRLPSGPAGGPLNLTSLVDRYLEIAPQIYSASRDGLPLENPRVDVSLDPSDLSIATARVVLLADGWTTPKAPAAPGSLLPPGQCGPLRATLTLPFQSSGTIPLEIVADTSTFSSPAGWDGGLVRLNLSGEWQPGPSALVWHRVDLDIASLHWLERDLTVAPIHAVLTPSPLRVEATVGLLGRPWSVTVGTVTDVLRDRAALPTARFTVDLAGRVDRELIALVTRLIPVAANQTAPDLTALVHFDQSAGINSRLTVTGTGELVRAEGQIVTGPVTVDGVSLNGGTVRFDYQGNRLYCDEAFAWTSASEASGTFELDTKTLDYRFLLTGWLRPADIDHWLDDPGHWWRNFWQDYHFNSAPPRAELDLAGSWGTPGPPTMFIAAEVADIAIHGVDLDQVRARISIHPGDWIDILGFSISHGTQSAKGAFRLAGNPDLPDDFPQSIDFSATSTFDLASAARLIGPEMENLITPYRFERAPGLDLHGRLKTRTADGWVHRQVGISVESAGAFAFEGFPVRDLVARVEVNDAIVDLPDLKFIFAGDGQVAGHAQVDLSAGQPRVSFDLALKGATATEAIHTVEAFQASTAGLPAPPPGSIEQRLAGGKIDLAMTASGTFPHLETFVGQGKLKLTGADLGQIKLLGPISDLLKPTFLDFTRLDFDSLESEFKLAGSRISFADLRLSGPTAHMDATGSYRIDDHTLDVVTEVIFAEKGKTFVNKVWNLITDPFTHALEGAFKLKLQGTAEKPTWSLVYSPANLIRKLTGQGTKPAPPLAPAPPSSPP